jgi:lipopolysaccharide transport system ATP-binding protein
MAQVAIAAAGLSKRYYVPSPHRADPSAGGGFGALARRQFRRRRSPSGTWIDAVADLSFTIDHGEAVGLIGRNGAGKSTLLKLLSRVTRPTAGHADVYGRVGALLEVGTGFHPELTGRENTFLSGAILGMSRRDISTRFDDIVAFAEIAPFIDMPVKHYSSGMYARLGFAVAAFLKPAILIVDEILAVGDLGFQAKCIAHMRQLSRDGTTILFVSHNLLAMADFCPRAIVMADGRLMFDGPTSEAIGVYRRILAIPAASEASVEGRPAHELRVNGRLAGETIECRPNDAIRIELEVDQPSEAPVVDIEFNLAVETPDGRIVIHLRNDMDGTVLRLGPGRRTLTIDIDDLALVPGTYTLWLRVVSLQAAPPVIWDTERLPLVVVGDQRLESIVQPRYRFGQRAESV